MTPGPLTGKNKTLEKRIVSWCLERIDLPVAEQSRYDAGTHLLLLLMAAVGNMFMESVLNASEWLGIGDTPSPRDFMYRLKSWSGKGLLEESMARLNGDVLNEARRRRMLPRAAVAALDYTDKEYFGKKDRGHCCRAPEKRGTTWFHRVASLSLVVRGGRYTVACVRVGPFTSHLKAVESLLGVADRWVIVKLLIMDRGLFGAAVQKFLKSRGTKVLLAVPKWKREKEVVKRCKGLKWLAEPWKIGGGDGWTIIVADNEWLREKLADRRIDEGHSVWVTDLPFRGNPLPFVRAYNRRWSIENSFQEEDRFQAKTKSPEPGLRFALIFLGVVLRNLWVLLKRGWEGLTTFLMKEVVRHEVLSCLIGLDTVGMRRRTTVAGA